MDQSLDLREERVYIPVAQTVCHDNGSGLPFY